MTTYYHAPFEGNPHKHGIVDVKKDAPAFPIQIREQMERQAKKMLGLAGRM